NYINPDKIGYKILDSCINDEGIVLLLDSREVCFVGRENKDIDNRFMLSPGHSCYENSNEKSTYYENLAWKKAFIKQASDKSLVVVALLESNFSIQPTLVMYHFDKNGEMINEADLPSLEVKDIAIDIENRIYLLQNTDITVFDLKGNMLETIENDEGSNFEFIKNDVDKNVIIKNSNISGKKELWRISRELNINIAQLPNWANELYVFNGKAFFCWDDYLFLYDEVDTQYKEYIALVDCGVTETDLKEIHISDENTVFFITKNSEVIVAGNDHNQKKEELTVGTVEASSSLKKSVANYNRTNSEVEVKLVEYGKGSASELNYSLSGSEISSNGEQLLFRELLAGNCPDIINLDYDSLLKFSNSNIFYDLTECVNASEKVTLGQNIIDSYTFKGKLISVPLRLKVKTVLVVDDDSNTNLFMDGNEYEYLEYYYYSSINKFYDEKKGTFDFDNDDFKRVLADCKARVGIKPRETGYFFINEEEKYHQYEYIIRSTYTIPVLNQILGTNKYKMLGYGYEGGIGRHFFVESDGSYGIYRKTDKKELAWDFLEFLLTEVNKTEISNAWDGLPANDYARNRLYELDSSDSTMIGSNGETQRVSYWGTVDVKCYQPFENEIIPIEEVIEIAEPINPMHNEILSILFDDVKPYFEGKKEINETISTIQNRVNLYMAEHEK
ncbi:MAG: hypothetical protein MJ227_04975, partial [Bacilli bacterium]|nr:hypothetical protein [Bacilli bacterium]